MEVSFSPQFLKQYNSFGSSLQDEVYEKIELFKDKDNHKQLKVYKLKGKLRNKYGFSVNYKIRIVFTYLSKKEIVLLCLGGHDMYK